MCKFGHASFIHKFCNENFCHVNWASVKWSRWSSLLNWTFSKLSFFGWGRGENLLLECIIVYERPVCPAALKLCFLATQFYPLRSLEQNFVFFSYHQTHCMSSSSYQRVFIFSKMYDNWLSANSKIISLIPWKYIGHYIYITWLNSENSYCHNNIFILFMFIKISKSCFVTQNQPECFIMEMQRVFS